LRVEGLGLRVEKLGFVVQGLGFRAQGLGVGIWVWSLCTPRVTPRLRRYAVGAPGACRTPPKRGIALLSNSILFVCVYICIFIYMYI
jgi:hypothetical protein